MLTAQQLDEFQNTGHLTVTSVFGDAEITAVLDDLAAWSEQFLASLREDQRNWYLEPAKSGQPALRKLDHPVYVRPVFRQLATDAELVAMVEQLIGPGVKVSFSQVFMKPPEVGGRKPIHQDNFYFGPDRDDATLTAWIALDDATIENGCLHYCDQHEMPVIEHVADDDEPFNLQIPSEIAETMKLTPAPVPRGGISFHHGNTPHQSSANRSQHPRRAVAIHYLRNDARLINSALPYEEDKMLAVT